MALMSSWQVVEVVEHSRPPQHADQGIVCREEDWKLSAEQKLRLPIRSSDKSVGQD